MITKPIKEYWYWWVADHVKVDRLIREEGWKLRFVIDKSPYWKNHLLEKEIEDDTDKPDI